MGQLAQAGGLDDRAYRKYSLRNTVSEDASVAKEWLYVRFIGEALKRGVLLGVIWGTCIGWAVTGFAFAPYAVPFAGGGLVIGLSVGFAAGLINGLVLGGLSMTVFRDAHDLQRYKYAMGNCAFLITVALLLPLVLVLLWGSEGLWPLILVPVVLITGFVATYAGHRVAGWYWQHTRPI
jgi:hypothetical protein